MNLNNLLARSWLLRITILAWIISAVFVALLVNRLDGIVHGSLYEYGLQFSYIWAMPFWSFERFIYICLAAPAILSGVTLFTDFWMKDKHEVPEVKYIRSKPISTDAKASNQNSKENHMQINCPKCHKLFGKPLNMLDFSSGKAKLVNVCPYCNQVLGDSDNESSPDFGVAETEEQVVQKNNYQSR